MAAKTQKVKLTVKAIGAMPTPPEGGRTWLYDAETPGLAVCKLPSGSTSFYLYKWHAGRPLKMKLGDSPGISIENARRLVGEKSLAMARGENPAADRKAAREELTYQELFDRYIDTHAKLKCKSWRDMQRMHDKYVGNFKVRRLSETTHEHVAKMHGRIGKEHGPYQANRVLQLVRAVLNFGLKARLVKSNPATGISMYPEVERERFIDDTEMPKFIAALEAEPNETIRDFIKLCLLTGQRRSNVQGMKWDDISLPRATWTIPASESKNAKPISVPLIADAMEILQRRLVAQMKAEAPEVRSNPYVLGGRYGKGHLVEPKGGWRRVLDRAGMADVRVHDLRRTYGSWLAAAGASETVIAKALGHRDLSQVRVYARLNLDPVRLAVNTAMGAVMSAATPKQIEGVCDESK